MPKIIDKEDKIKFICDEAYKIFVKYGIEKFSLNKFIININMSKGQFYHYFSTKEQLVYQVMSKKTYELINYTLEEYNHQKEYNLLYLIS